MPVAEGHDGTRLFVSDWGDGVPVLFVHGWSLTHAMWEYQVPFLAAHGVRAIAYDRRGHGRSDVPATGYDADSLAQDLACVVDALDLHDVTLVAHSAGSRDVARLFARGDATTARVRGVVFVAPNTPYLLQAPDNPDGVPEAYFDATYAQLARDRAGWIDDNAAPYFALDRIDVSAGIVDWQKRMMFDTSLPVALATYRDFTRTDARADVAAIDVPALVVHGTVDASAPIALTGEPTAALLPRGRVAVYDGAPHGLYVTHRDRLNADLLAFAHDAASVAAR
jgi:pimeloyl-ACP methyl ester carboxylesterase